MSAIRINPALLPDSLQETDLVLVPNHRLRTALVDYYQNLQQQHTFRTPRIMAVDVWARDLWHFGASAGLQPCTDLRVLSPGEELLLWTSVISNSLDEVPLLNPTDTAGQVRNSYQTLRQWHTGSDDPLADSNQDNVQIFRRWLNAYSALCKKNGLISLVDMLPRLKALPQLKQLIRAERIMLVNFTGPPPLYTALFNSLTNHCEVVSVNTVPESVSAICSKQAFTTASEEISACADWLNELLAQNVSSHIGIVTVQDEQYRTQLEYQLRRQVSQLSSDNQSDAHSSRQSMTGLPATGLAQQGIIHTALLLLELNLNGDRVNSENFCRILHSPYLTGSEAERENRIQLEYFIRRNKQAHSELADLSKLCLLKDKNYSCPLLGSSLREFRKLARGLSAKSLPTHRWRKLFTAQLEAMGWPGETLVAQDGNSDEQAREQAQQTTTTDDSHIVELNTTEQRSIELLKDALHTLAGLSSVLGSLTVEQAYDYLRTLCHNAQVDYQQANNSSVSLFTLEEAAGLHFDYVWLAGFDDQHCPAPARPSPFLPHSLQHQLNLPGSSAELQHEQAWNLFNELQRGIATTFICSHHRLFEDQERRPAAFTANWSASSSATPDTADVSDIPVADNNAASTTTPNTATNIAAALESVPDIASPLQGNEHPHGGQSIISDQSSCPFRGFAAHRLNAAPLDEFQRGLTPQLRGTALHLALAHLFTAIGDSTRLHALSDKKLDELVEHGVEEALNYLHRQQRQTMTPRFKVLEHNRLKRLLQGFVAVDKERPDFTVLAHEKKLSWQYGDLTLNIRVDRIDRLNEADGQLAIIDYKSGKTASPASWQDERLTDMQLPLYLTVSAETSDGINDDTSTTAKNKTKTEPVIAVMIAHVHVQKFGYSGETAAEQFHPRCKTINAKTHGKIDWDNLASRWQEQVHAIAKEFMAGRAIVQPINPTITCKRCGLQEFCRIADSSAIAEDVADD
ncbi:MAG: PD-(D/E)XK nuclease family protein [Pseudohongiellaceae bacterium]